VVAYYYRDCWSRAYIFKSPYIITGFEWLGYRIIILSYVLIYIEELFNYNGFLATIMISIILSLLLTTIIDQKVSHTPVPEWVKPELFSIIKKKQNVPYINKFLYS
jgi:hypothetical protein